MLILKEFKEFAVKGNVVDLAVGVIIGGAFGKIVSSLVADVIMPPIGYLAGGFDFKKLGWVLKTDAEGKPIITLAYGNFIQNVADFIIIAVSIFAIIKIINTVRRRFEKNMEQAKTVRPPQDIALLTEIRDLLKKQQK